MFEIVKCYRPDHYSGYQTSKPDEFVEWGYFIKVHHEHGNLYYRLGDDKESF